MNERLFIQGIHRKLSPNVYRWKIAASFANGVPDCYYSGNLGDLWVEYKYLRLSLTKLQEHWLTARHKEGRKVAVVVGFKHPIPCRLYPDITFTDKKYIEMSSKDLANWIEKQTYSDSPGL